MRRSDRPVDSSLQLHRLEQQHSQLKRLVADLERRHYLTASEQLKVQALKKRKLATKDALQTMRQDRQI